ncbi:MAG: phosphohistidine phosphatase [Nocardioidaceae bacterium]|nr:phosphohistidine phosphatase [Nocardioidaceae bacterium]
MCWARCRQTLTPCAASVGPVGAVARVAGAGRDSAHTTWQALPMAVGGAGTHRIVVLRHAAAEKSAASDHARELTARGRRDATAVGELLTDILDPDADTVALVSTAVRARQTWEAAAAELAMTVEERQLDELYEADSNELVDMLALLPDETEVVVVVGHNPTMEALVNQLENGDDEDLAGRLAEDGFPKAGLAVLEQDGSWSELETGSCRLERLEVGRA